MTGSTPSFPPPEDAAARYDAVLRRGRSLRRRHQVAVGAGTGGLLALVLLAVVVVSAGRGGGKDDQVVTDPRPTTTTSTTTTTTTKPTFAVTATATATKITVTVTDPAFPVAAGARQCVYVRVAPSGPSGVATTEGTGCAGAGEADITTDLTPIEAEIGCAGVAVNGPAPTPTAAEPLTHTFTFNLPTGLQPGKYEAEATGVSGIGDGCAPSGPGEAEHVAPVQTIPFTVSG
jgi:hypothetical protein